MREKRTSSESKRETHRSGDKRSSTTIIFADVINSTHTGCLSHFTIEGAELSTPLNARKIRVKWRENSAAILERDVNHCEKVVTPSFSQKRVL